MGWSFRKSLNLGGGFRLNLSKGGIGLSGGIRGFRVGVGPRGTRVQSTIPGTGITYRKESGWSDSGQEEPSHPAPSADRPIRWSLVLLWMLVGAAVTVAVLALLSTQLK